jgi:hypothetical protein
LVRRRQLGRLDPRHLRELLAAVVYNTLLLLQLLARKELDPGTVALVRSAEHENASWRPST